MSKQTTLRTGDLILFHSNTTFIGSMIQFFTSSIYCHIGMVIVDPHFENFQKKGVYLWQSSMEEKEKDVADHCIKNGVEIVPLSDLIKNDYADSTIYVRHLDTNHSISTKVLNDIREKVHNKPYDMNPIDWLFAEFRKDIEPKKTSRFWCSAFVGYIYSRLGIILPNVDWSILRPSDFATDSVLRFKVNLSPIKILEDS